MPHTVAPPPWNGDAATGHWSPAAPDSAPSDGAPSDARTSEPALQTPAAAARTAAAGVASTDWAARPGAGSAPTADSADSPDPAARPSLARALATGFVLALCAVLIAGIAVATMAALRLLFSGDGRMTFSLTSSALLLAGFAVAVAATLAVPNRLIAPRPATLALAAIVSAAWPISGHPVPAAAAAIALTGLALAGDIRLPGGRRVGGTLACLLLAGVACALVIAGLAVAETHRTDGEPAPAAAQPAEPDRPAPSLGETPVEAATPEASATPAASPAPEESPAAGPEAGESPATKPDAGESPTAGPDAGESPIAPGPDTGETPTAPSPPAPTPGVESAPSVPAPDEDPKAAPADPEPAEPEATTPTDPSAPLEPGNAAPTGPTPEDFVRGYYEQLDGKRFEEAWASLSPAVQASFGGFEHWRNGYEETLSNTPSAFEVDGDSVTHLLVARNRGCPRRQFLVRWTLEPADATWTVKALSASALDDVVCS